MITDPQFTRSFLGTVERSTATRPLTTKERRAHTAYAPPTAGVQSMSDPLNRSVSDPLKEFVEQMARLTVPVDDTEENRGRREAAASESGTPIGELDESDIVASADDEFLCSEAIALWLRQLIFSLMRYTGKHVVAQRYRLITIWL